MTHLFNEIADIFPDAKRAQLVELMAVLDRAAHENEPPLLVDVVPKND